jgi:hypothetical protein
MSYSERDGQVILTMSREDYGSLIGILGSALLPYVLHGGPRFDAIVALANRLNEGNPNYTPYQTGEKQ